MAKSAYANITLTSSGVFENSPTARDRILLAASKFFTSHCTFTRFKNILALSSYPNGSEYFLPGGIELSLTPGSSYACSRVLRALAQSYDLISTSDFISINTGFSLILKSCANAYCRLFSAAFTFPLSQLIRAASTCASMSVGSFWRQLCSSRKAEFTSFASHFALASKS